MSKINLDDVPFNKDTTGEILKQELPEVDTVEIRSYKSSKKSKKKEQLINQAIQASDQSQYSTQLRDIKEIQMNAYSTGSLVSTDQVSTGATVCSIIATVLLTIVIIIGLLYGMLSMLGLRVVVADDNELAPQVPQNCLLALESVETYDDVFEGDIIEYNGVEKGEIGIIFWTEITTTYPDGVVWIVGNMTNYNDDINFNTKVDPQQNFSAAMSRYNLSPVVISDITGKLSFSIPNVGSFVVFIFDNWYFVIGGLALLVIVLFLLKFIFDRKFEAELFNQIEEDNKRSENFKNMLETDLMKTEDKFKNEITTQKEMLDVLHNSNKKIAKKTKDEARRKRIEAELERRKREQIEQLKELAEKTKKENIKQNEQETSNKEENQEQTDEQKLENIVKESNLEQINAETQGKQENNNQSNSDPNLGS